MAEKIIIFGAGGGGKHLIECISKEHIKYVIDNNSSLIGKDIAGIRIVSVEQMYLEYKNELVVIASEIYEKEMELQLKELHINNFMTAKQYRVKNLILDARDSEKRIFLLNTNDNVNIGDQLITYSEKYFFQKYLPEFDVIEFTSTECIELLHEIKSNSKTEDIIIISGGGYLGSLWLKEGEENVRSIIQMFPNNRIIIFPQTLFFSDDEYGKKQCLISQKIYNAHDNLTIILRDNDSYQLATNIFNQKINKLFMPDIVTLLDMSGEICSTEGLLLCMRDDKEKIIKEDVSGHILEVAKKRAIAVDKMSMLSEKKIEKDQRWEIIQNRIKKVKSHRIVITDRLHCMLMCAICGIPCLVFDNLSKKVSGTYEWIKNNEYIHMVKNDESLEELLERYMNVSPHKYDNKHCLRMFDQLSQYIKEGRVSENYVQRY